MVYSPGPFSVAVSAIEALDRSFASFEHLREEIVQSVMVPIVDAVTLAVAVSSGSDPIILEPHENCLADKVCLYFYPGAALVIEEIPTFNFLIVGLYARNLNERQSKRAIANFEDTLGRYLAQSLPGETVGLHLHKIDAADFCIETSTGAEVADPVWMLEIHISKEEHRRMTA